MNEKCVVRVCRGGMCVLARAVSMGVVQVGSPIGARATSDAFGVGIATSSTVPVNARDWDGGSAQWFATFRCRSVAAKRLPT
jgi:hypothetical protein